LKDPQLSEVDNQILLNSHEMLGKQEILKQAKCIPSKHCQQINSKPDDWIRTNARLFSKQVQR